jgi:AraC-like DNA-binding protein
MSMDYLAEKMGLSRSSLHRKIKQETGLSPNLYIREVRLQEARRLLENRLVGTVAEAGQRVGFHKRAYFSQLFVERFGCLPSAFMEGDD